MPEIQYAFRCYHCHGITRVVQDVQNMPEGRDANASKKIEVTKYCEHCNRANVVEIPDWWDNSPLILNRHAGFLGYSDGVPTLQGKQA